MLASSVPPRILQYLLATYLPPSPSSNMHKEDGYSLSQYGANEYALLPLASIGFAWATVQEIFLCITCCALAFKMKLHRVVGFLAMVRVNCVCVCCVLCVVRCVEIIVRDTTDTDKELLPPPPSPPLPLLGVHVPAHWYDTPPCAAASVYERR